MNSQDLETLSAMLDSEASELELRRVLKAIVEDPDIAGTWERMSLVQAVLHDDNLKDYKRLLTVGGSFSRSVAQAIANEPVPTASGSAAPDSIDASPARWTRPLAKMAVAAAVALAFFLGMQTTINSPTSDVAAPVAQRQAGQQEPASAPGNSAPALLAGAGANDTAQPVIVREVDPQARQRLEEYIQSVSITREEPQQLEQLEDSPLYRLVNEIQGSQ